MYTQEGRSTNTKINSLINKHLIVFFKTALGYGTAPAPFEHNDIKYEPLSATFTKSQPGKKIKLSTYTIFKTILFHAF